MSYFNQRSSTSLTHGMSSLSSASTSSCGANCPCRTVSCVSSTTPILARVQLYPNIHGASTGPSSPYASNENLLDDSNMLENDPSRQDFDFSDIFDNEGSDITTNQDLHAGNGSPKREESQTDFSFSHYAGYIKGSGSARLARTKSGLLKSRHVRVKSGSRRGG